MHREAFITGSQIFGYATPESDTDLVVYMTYPEFCLLVEKLGVDTNSEEYGGGDGYRSIRLGNLNMICCWAAHIYDAFETAKAEVLREIRNYKRIMTRDVSVEIHEKHRQAARNQYQQSQIPWFLG